MSEQTNEEGAASRQMAENVEQICSESQGNQMEVEVAGINQISESFEKSFANDSLC